MYKVDSGISSELDSAAEQLLRVSRIHITELELMEFIRKSVASEDPRLSNDRHPLAGGGMSLHTKTIKLMNDSIYANYIMHLLHFV
jgi:hypothetical protein